MSTGQSTTHGKRGKILISSNSCWNLVNFRKPVIEALISAGYQVSAAAPADGYEVQLEAMGVKFVPVDMQSAGTSPTGDFRLLIQYSRMFQVERPTLYLGFTAKPNIYGSLAARLAGVPVVATISGLGSAFLKGGFLGGILLRLYRAALRSARTIMFQNSADRDLFITRRIARPDQARLVAGSGVDLYRFTPQPVTGGSAFCFLLVARMLRDKGIFEYVEAARIVSRSHPSVRFQLLGGPGSENPSAVPEWELARWAAESTVDQLGGSEDVRPHIAAADCLVLPSYREGLPRSLLEGAAMARPLIATDVPGCRDVVEDGVNGFLCEVKSAASLAAAMQRMLKLTATEREAMGRAGRRKVEAEFDQQAVAAAYLSEVAR